MASNGTTTTVKDYTASIFFLNEEERQTTITHLFVLLRKFDKSELDDVETNASSWLFYLLESLVEDEIKHKGDFGE